MHSLGEVELEVMIGTFRANQKLTIASSLITDCLLCVDFLASHRINLDFANIGAISSFNASEDAELRNHSCSVRAHTYPEVYAAVKSVNEFEDEEWECLGAVPKYGSLPTTEYADTAPEFVNIIKEFQDIYSSVPGVVNVDPFSIRTGNANPVKLTPIIVPQAFQ